MLLLNTNVALMLLLPNGFEWPLQPDLGRGEGREGPLSAMDGAIEPYTDVFTGVSRPTLPPLQIELQRTHQAQYNHPILGMVITISSGDFLVCRPVASTGASRGIERENWLMLVLCRPPPKLPP